jgi:hypothetical protein
MNPLESNDPTGKIGNNRDLTVEEAISQIMGIRDQVHAYGIVSDEESRIQDILTRLRNPDSGLKPEDAVKEAWRILFGKQGYFDQYI